MRLPPSNLLVPVYHLGGERHCESYVFCLRTQRGGTGQGSNSGPSGPKSNALATEPPRLPFVHLHRPIIVPKPLGQDCSLALLSMIMIIMIQILVVIAGSVRG